MARNRRNYEQVTTNPEESIEITGESTAVAGDERRGDRSAQVALLDQESTPGGLAAEGSSSEDGNDEGELITVVILNSSVISLIKLSINEIFN